MRVKAVTSVIPTKRTLLRAVMPSDLDALLRLHLDDATRRYAWVDNLQNAEENLKWIEAQHKLYPRGLGLYAIEEKTTGTFIGVCGLRKRPDLAGIVDIAYRINPEYRLRGYATETARAVLAHGFKHLFLQQISAQVHKDNYASRRIMYRLGFNLKDSQSGWLLYQKKSEDLELSS